MRPQARKKIVPYTLALALLSAGAAVADDGGHKGHVDCGKGQSLNQALASHDNDNKALVVEFTGTCTGNVTIPGSDITLRGADASATIIGTVNIQGQSRVTLESFTVRDTPPGDTDTRIGDGILIINSQNVNLNKLNLTNVSNITIDIEGSTAFLTDVTVTHPSFIGLTIALGSVVETHGTVTVTQGANNGIVVNDAGQLQIANGSKLVTTDNQGTGLFVEEKGHVTIHGESEVVADRNGIGINVVDHGSLVYGGAKIDISNNRLLGVQVGQLSDWTVLAGIVPDVTINNNGGPGVSVLRTAFVRLRENTTISGNAGPGLVVDGSSVAVRGTLFQNNNNGHGDVFLNFGSQATFDGGNTFVPPICDGTSRSRGQFTCEPTH